MLCAFAPPLLVILQHAPPQVLPAAAAAAAIGPAAVALRTAVCLSAVHMCVLFVTSRVPVQYIMMPVCSLYFGQQQSSSRAVGASVSRRANFPPQAAAAMASINAYIMVHRAVGLRLPEPRFSAAAATVECTKGR